MYITVYGVFMANASKQTFVFLIVSVTSISNGSLLYQGCTVLMSPASPVFHTEATVNIADIKWNKLFNSPLYISLIIWETRLGEDRIPDWS